MWQLVQEDWDNGIIQITDEMIDHIFFRLFIDMERSNISARSGGWKQSVVKNNTGDSRIGKDNRDQLPVKFSPAKYAEITGNTSKSLVRSKILSYSQDEIVVGNQRERSQSKDRYPTKKLTLQTPRSNHNDGNLELKLTLKNEPSEKSLEPLVFSPLKKGAETNTKDATEFIQEIKLQYMRFKDKILGELKKLQDDIKNAIQQVMTVVSKSLTQQNLSQNNLKVVRHGSHENRSPSFGLPADEPLRIVNKLPKVNLSESPPADLSKYRDLLGSQSSLQSVLPKIRQKMSKFFDIMGQLKSQINDQAMYTPVNVKYSREDEESPELGQI